MISFELYQNLIEVVGLDSKIGVHLEKINSHNKRLNLLAEQKKSKEQKIPLLEKSLKEKRISLKQFESQLESIEIKQKQSRKNSLKIKSDHELRSYEKETASLSSQKEELEEKVLSLMNELELGDTELNESNSFVKGVTKTIEELGQEVQRDVAIEQKEISNYQSRIDLLLAALPVSLRNSFMALNKKYRFNSPITFIRQDSKGQYCNHCSIKVPIEEQIALDKGTQIKTCYGCGRMFIPSSLL
ncbi:MAG: hypothetical protein HQK49_19830 [Oligoflexia bacterium]|nr:hypothetical protein [Oligoflexia bacterium]